MSTTGQDVESPKFTVEPSAHEEPITVRAPVRVALEAFANREEHQLVTQTPAPPALPLTVALSGRSGISCLPEPYHGRSLSPDARKEVGTCPGATNDSDSIKEMTVAFNTASASASPKDRERQSAEKLGYGDTGDTTEKARALASVPDKDMLVQKSTTARMASLPVGKQAPYDPLDGINPMPVVEVPPPRPEPSVPGAFRQGGLGCGDPESRDPSEVQEPTTDNDNPSLLLAEASLVVPPQLPVAQPGPAPTDQSSRQKRTIQMAALLLVLVLVVVAIVVGSRFGTQNNNAGSSMIDARPPRERVAATIWYQIARASKQPEWLTEDINGLLLGSPTNSSHLSALRWLLYDDPLQLSPSADNLLQRFFAADFYFATTVDGPWTSCNPVEEAMSKSANEFCYYQQYVGSMQWRYGDGPKTYNILQSDVQEALATRWLSSAHECQWAGLFCNEHGRIEYLHLDEMNLTGTVPPELSLLEDLSSVSLTQNNLEGALPRQLFLLSGLRYLDLYDNQFTGRLPDEWWRSNLESLSLDFNSFSLGSLPSEIGTMATLKNLHLIDAGITGTIPKELYKLDKLEHLWLRWNQITGTIATDFALLSNLAFLSMQVNPMWGTIPTELGLLTKLVELDIWGMGLTGTIPEELFSENFQSLNALIIGANSISGTLSSRVANIPNLGNLLLQKNPNLVGPVPSELGLLTTLKRLDVDKTGMSGSMPAELCAQRSDELLYRLSADCLPLESDNSTISMSCSCCTKCCDQETHICIKY